jgi:Ca2+-binding EF-hand superfamily protein
MSKPSSSDPLLIQAKKIAPLVPDAVVHALVAAANETAKHQATSALTPRLARALMDPNPAKSKHLIKTPRTQELAASKVDFPSRTPSAGAAINASVEACLERLIRRMSSRVKADGCTGLSSVVKQSLDDCDVDSDGCITRAELSLALKQCGVREPDKADVDILMAAFDRSGCGLVGTAAVSSAFQKCAKSAVESRTAPNSASGRINSGKLLDIIRCKLLEQLTPSNVKALRSKFSQSTSGSSGSCSANTFLQLLQEVGIRGQADVTREIWNAFGCSNLQDSIDFAKFIEHVMMAKSAELDELFSESAGGGKSKAGVAAPVKHNVKAIKFLRDRITSHLPAMVPRHMMNEFKLHDTNRDNTIDKEEFYRMMSRCALQDVGFRLSEVMRPQVPHQNQRRRCRRDIRVRCPALRSAPFAL